MDVIGKNVVETLNDVVKSTFVVIGVIVVVETVVVVGPATLVDV